MSTSPAQRRLDAKDLPFGVKNVPHNCAHHLIGKRPQPKNHPEPCVDTSKSELDHRFILDTPTGDVLLAQGTGDQSRTWAKQYADTYELEYAAVADIDDGLFPTIFWNPKNPVDAPSVIKELRKKYGV